MSLARSLTLSRVKALAGSAAFLRGDAYWRNGHVTSCRLDGDALVGTVAGRFVYETRVADTLQSLRSQCTCPMAGTFCKHAVALALAWLEGGQGASEDASTAGERVFERSDELDAWAAQHAVKHALDYTAGVLLPRIPQLLDLPHLRYTVTRLRLRDLASVQTGAHYVGAHAARPVAAAAYRLLEDEAAAAREALAEEAARPVTAPDPALAALWARLLELRAEVRAAASPRPRARRAAGTWAFEPRGPTLIWKDPDRTRTWDYLMISPVAELTMHGDGSAALTCSCRASLGRCTHQLALVDATLDRLADPARADEARVLVDELLRPGWARALAALEQLEQAATKPRPVIEVWWQLEQELGEVTLTPIVKKLTKRGVLSAGSRLSPGKLVEAHRASLSDRDLAIAEHLAAWEPGTRAAGTYPVRALLAAVDHPRLVGDDGETPVVLRKVPLEFTALEAGDTIRIEPTLDGARLSPRLLAALLAAFAPGEPLFTAEPGGPCLLIEVSDEARRLWTVLATHGEAFPREAHAELLDRLARLESRLPIAVPAALKGKELASSLETVVRVRLLPDAALELEALVRPAPGAPLFPPGAGPRDVRVIQGGERGYVRRALGDELPHVRGLLARLPLEAAEEGPPLCFRIGDPDAALALVAAVQQPPPGLSAEWVDHKPTIVSGGGPGALRVSVDRKRDWFGIDGELEVDGGRLELAVLLDAIRRQQRYVRLDANRWVELSDTLRQRLVAVADQTFAARDRLELSPGAVPAIQALAEAGAQVTQAPAWAQLTERLAAARTLRPRPPAALAATLRPYQVEGHAWLTRVAAWGAGACLADDMGLGKTVQAIAVLLDRAKHGPALVIAPTSVTLNWVEELRRFAPSLRPVLYTDQADRAASLAKLGKRDVLILSYGLLVRDIEPLARLTFGTLVIDEAQALKNPATQRARAARKLDAGFRVALSGTPLENHLGELWSLFAVVFPGLLGSWEQFRTRFAQPIERHADPEARAALSRVIQPFLLRRTKQDVARELPSRTEIHVPIALSKDEQTLYEDARLAAVAHLSKQGKAVRDEQRRFAVLAALTRLRLLASHPRLYDAQSAVASSKMARLLELVEELRSEGHRALVFSQFTSHLALVREALGKAGFRALYLDGETPVRQRAQLIRAFQDGDGDVFLISLKAGGTGINLTAADYVIHLDPWWNPAVEDQATDRAHRIGQTRPVTVYRLITRGTVEEQILAMHRDKRALIAGVLDGTDVAAKLTTRDLLALLAPGAAADA